MNSCQYVIIWCLWMLSRSEFTIVKKHRKVMVLKILVNGLIVEIF
jgi:hypothetical protein